MGSRWPGGPPADTARPTDVSIPPDSWCSISRSVILLHLSHSVGFKTRFGLWQILILEFEFNGARVPDV